jgi:hypothetical protein
MLKLSAYDKALEDQGLLIRPGDKVGRSIMLHIIPPSNYKRGVLKCECGTIFIAWMTNIVSGRTKGCGCSRGKYKRS